MPIIDANVILRYLLEDHPEMSQQAKEIILSGAQAAQFSWIPVGTESFEIYDYCQRRN